MKDIKNINNWEKHENNIFRFPCDKRLTFEIVIEYYCPSNMENDILTAKASLYTIVNESDFFSRNIQRQSQPVMHLLTLASEEYHRLFTSGC